MYERSSSWRSRSRCSSSTTAASIIESVISGTSSPSPERMTAITPVSELGSGGYRSCSSRANATCSGSLCATATSDTDPSRSTMWTVHQSLTRATASSATRESVSR